jgi:type I restriction enzyme, S subunit
MSASPSPPNGCRWVSLSDLVVDGPTNGYSGPTGPDAAGTPTLRLSATTSGTFVLNEATTKRLYETIPPDSDLWLKPGDLLVQRSNTIEHVGTTAIYEGPPQAYIYPDLMMRLRFREGVVAKFVCQYMNSQAGRSFFLRVAAGSSGSMPKVSGAKLRAMQVPLPPLEEQQRIAKVLDQAEMLRAKRRATLAQLDTLTQAIFLDLFGDPIQNPRGFPVKQMIDLVDPQRQISYGILMPGPEQTQGVKYIRVVDMKDGIIELSGVRKTTEAVSHEFRRSLLKSGDLLMSIRGHVGRLAIVPPELDQANITQDTARLAIRDASTIFVRECLRMQSFQEWMARHTKGVAVKGINLSDVKMMPVITPPRSAQDNFANQARAVEKMKAEQRVSLAELDELFASLQHRAFRGEL